MGRSFRNFHTHQERRVWDRYEEMCRCEFPELKLRRRRSPRLLPTAWKDVHRRDVFDFGWKRHRETQYRPISDLVLKVVRPKIEYDTTQDLVGVSVTYRLGDRPVRKVPAEYRRFLFPFRVRKSFRRYHAKWLRGL